jgi:hypothetical protein
VQAGGRSQFQLVPGAGHMLLDYQASELAESIFRSLAATTSIPRSASG